MTGSVADSSALQPALHVSISSETVIQTDSLVAWAKVQGSFITKWEGKRLSGLS